MYFFGKSVPALLCLATSFVGLSSAFPISEISVLEARGSGLKVSSNPADWPSTAQLAAALTTAPNKAFFWTGRNGAVSVEETAAKIAAAAGGQTLESALARAGITMPAFDVRNTAAVDVWVAASKLFAEGASGEAFCVQGATLRPGNVFESDELPILKTNPRVTKVTRIDSTTKDETPIFVRTKRSESELEGRLITNAKKVRALKKAKPLPKPVPKPLPKPAAPPKPVVVAKPPSPPPAPKPVVKPAPPPPAPKSVAKPLPKPVIAPEPVAASTPKPPTTKPVPKPVAEAPESSKAVPKKTTTAKTSTASKAAASEDPAPKLAAPAPGAIKSCISHPIRCA